MTAIIQTLIWSFAAIAIVKIIAIAWVGARGMRIENREKGGER